MVLKTKTETSPRALVFSSGRPERNAVSIATCRHSVMTGECACLCVRACVCVCSSLRSQQCVRLCRVGGLTGAT